METDSYGLKAYTAFAIMLDIGGLCVTCFIAGHGSPSIPHSLKTGNVYSVMWLSKDDGKSGEAIVKHVPDGEFTFIDVPDGMTGEGLKIGETYVMQNETLIPFSPQPAEKQ